MILGKAGQLPLHEQLQLHHDGIGDELAAHIAPVSLGGPGADSPLSRSYRLPSPISQPVKADLMRFCVPYPAWGS